ncbi:MAG: hypothetical protein ACREDR_38770, partial [Blastocatellia bacterium]
MRERQRGGTSSDRESSRKKCSTYTPPELVDGGGVVSGSVTDTSGHNLTGCATSGATSGCATWRDGVGDESGHNLT